MKMGLGLGVELSQRSHRAEIVSAIARRARRRVGIASTYSPAWSFHLVVIHYGRNLVPHTRYRMEQRALACAADRALATAID